jgi:hypothetical protein
MIWLLIALMFVAGVSAQPVYRDETANYSFRDSLLFIFSERQEADIQEYYLSLLMLTDKNIGQEEMRRAELKMQTLYGGLPKRTKNFKLFVQSVFRYVHGTFLRNYTEYPSFYTTVTRGDYDCLTATTVFALVLKRLDIRFEIVEIKQHIYLLAYDEQGRRVLIESTDPKNGCVLFEADIKERLKEYDSKNRQAEDDLLGAGNYSKNVDLKQLAGLHFFNQAVKMYNKAEFVSSVDYLKTADVFYPSARISGLMVLSLDAISKRKNLKPEQRIAVMEKYKKHYETVKDFQGVVSAR